MYTRILRWCTWRKFDVHGENSIDSHGCLLAYCITKTPFSVKENEWMEVGSWAYANFDQMSGVSFLPFSEHTYRQAPYQDCDREQYESLLKVMPKDVDWGQLSKYETVDTTVASQELACANGLCEIV